MLMKKKRAQTLSNLDKQEKQDLSAMEDESSKQLETLKKTLQEDKANLKKKVKSKETLALKLAEVENKARTAIASIKAELTSTSEQKAEIYKAIKGSVRRLQLGSTISEEEYLKLDEYSAVDFFKVGMGAESLLNMVKNVNLDDLVSKLRQEMLETTGAKKN